MLVFFPETGSVVLMARFVNVEDIVIVADEEVILRFFPKQH